MRSELHAGTWIPTLDGEDELPLAESLTVRNAGPFRAVKEYVESEIVDLTRERTRWVPVLPVPHNEGAQVDRYDLEIAPKK